MTTRNDEIELEDLLHIGDVVRHKISKMVGQVTGFAHDGSIDVMVGHTGPYKQQDFERMTVEKKAPKKKRARK